jgi:hypothetical protein
MTTLTNHLARLANSANVLVTAITVNSSAITSVNVGGNVTANTISVGNNNVSPFTGMKNRIINGNFEFWQRGTSVTLVPNTLRYLADRWTAAGFQQGRHQRVSVTSPPAGLVSRYALRVGSSTTAEIGGSGTRMASRQKIESVNCVDLAGQVVTLSFWIRFSAATVSSVSNTGQSAYGDFFYSLMYNTGSTDSDTGSDVSGDSQSFVGIANGSLPTTWTKYTLTATVPAGCKNISVNFQFQYLGSTSSADTVYYDVTSVQLEAGSVATPFEFRSYGTELALCQRYYFQSKKYGLGMAGADEAHFIVYGPRVAGSEWLWTRGYFPVQMRADPTINVSDAAGNIGKITIWTSVGGSSTSNITPYTMYADVNGYSISEYFNVKYGFFGSISASIEL